LLQKFGPTCAARAAGLHNYLALEHVPPQFFQSLSDSNAVLRGNLTAAVDDAYEQTDAA
jgi:hypothetical protein